MTAGDQRARPLIAGPHRPSLMRLGPGRASGRTEVLIHAGQTGPAEYQVEQKPDLQGRTGSADVPPSRRSGVAHPPT